ncbi:Regulator of chromosome condensation (RCC1) repeat protein [compost metagenome]
MVLTERLAHQSLRILFLLLSTLFIASCSFDLVVSPSITADQVLRKISVTSGSEMILEEGQEYEISVLVQTPHIPNLQSKPVGLAWSILDPDEDFEVSSGEIEVDSLEPTTITFKIKPKKDAFIEDDESFNLFFSGVNFESLNDSTIRLIVQDRTTPAKVEASLALVDFGAHLINDSADRTLTFTNTGDATAETLVFSSLSAPFSFKGGSFPGIAGSCAGTLTGGSSCTVVLTYSSGVAASDSSSLTWSYTNPAQADNGSSSLKGLSVEVTAILGGLPNSRSNASALNVAVSGIDITNYKYKVGLAASTNCSVASGYSADLAIAQSITTNLASWANQNLRLCVIGQESHGVWQLYSQATSHDWFYDSIVPTVTIEQKVGQADPARTLPVEFTVTFSEQVSALSAADIQQTGTATGVTWTALTSDFITFTVRATSVTADGTIIPSLSAGAVTDLAGNENALATGTDRSVLYDSTAPALTINQKAGQSDPTNSLPIHFTVVFSEPINPASFTDSDITQNGTALGMAWTLATVDNKTWTLSVITSGEGTIIPFIPAGQVQDASGNQNSASTSTDNSVTYSTSAPNNASSLAWQQSSPANTTSLVAEWVKSASVLSSQSVQFYTGANCDTPFGAAEDPGTTGQTQTLTGVNGSIYTYKITSVDLATNSIESSCSAPLLVDTTVPTITNVTSTKTNGAYKAGSVIDIQVSFSEDVAVTGTPVINLNTTPARSASFSSGSGTDTLTFNYTVQAGDSSADLNYVATNSLTIVAASIKDEATNDATLTLPGLASAGSLGTNKNIVIDTMAPTVDVFSVSNTNPTNSTTYNITSSVSGSPTDYCILENSMTVSSCSWINGAALPASFTVSATNNSKTLYAWVRDAAGNISAMATSNSVVLDTLAPTLVLTGFPTGNSAKYNLTITPSGTDIVSYKYKIGPTASTNCASAADYSGETLINSPIVEDISGLANGGVTLCAVGKDTAGNWQADASATEKTWTKNTPVLQFSLSSSSISEYDSPSHTVQVSIPSSVDINVSAAYSFSDSGTYPAENEADYTGNSGNVTILAGATTANIVIPIIDDLRYENNETFNVHLNTGTGATLGATTSHVVTITDDDDPPLVSIQDVFVVEGESTSLRASLSASSDKGDVTINWEVDSCGDSNCASSPTDYTMASTSGTATIPQGQNYVDFSNVTTVDNASDDSFRKVAIKINSVSGGTLLSGKAYVYINDNDYPAGKDAILVTATTNSACAVTSNNRLYCWGDNSGYQLGQGDKVARTAPVHVPLGANLPVATAVGGNNKVCALTTSGQLYCWGSTGSSTNGFNSVGDGSTSSARTTPTYISSLGSGVTSVGLAFYSTCALKNGGVYCWGSDQYNLVGRAPSNPFSQIATPTLMPSPIDQDVTKLSVGHTHACALKTNDLYCWGSNSNAELGQGSASSGSPVALKVNGIGSVVDVWAGYFNTCAKNSLGEVYCWGNNAYFQLKSTSGSVTSPLHISEFDNADGMHLRQTACVIHSGQLKCRGTNVYGAVGINIIEDTVKPLSIPAGGDQDVTSVAASIYSNNFTCFVRSGQVYCSGFAGSGSLGDGYEGQFSSPVLSNNISGAGGPSKIFHGNYHACGLYSGAVRCWGVSSNYRTGNLSLDPIYLSPTPVKGLTSGYTQIAGTGSGTCALHSSGELKCWGHYQVRGVGNTTSSGNPVTPTGMVSGVTAVSGNIGNNAICAIKDGEAYCWGYNTLGNLGTGDTNDKLSPYRLTALGNDNVDIKPGSNHTCVLKSSGKVFCAGQNNYGGLGLGDTVERLTYNEVPNLSGVTAIATRGYGSCAVKADKSVWCWGYYSGQGTSSVLVPTEITAIQGTVKLIGGYYNYCALLETNVVKCWGDNVYGQQALGTYNTTAFNTPQTTQFGALGTITDIELGAYKVCVQVGSDYYCSGRDTYSEFATSNKPYRLAPISVMPFP